MNGKFTNWKDFEKTLNITPQQKEEIRLETDLKVAVNGNGDMVIAINNNDIIIMKMEEYKEKVTKENIEEHLLKAEDDIKNGRVKDAREVFKEWREKNL